MSSTFDGLYIARSGVRTARVNLNIAGQNITNATTDDYTRQRVDQSAISPSGYGSLYAQNPGDAYGQGSIATGVSQIRDAFLDGEYRTQNAKSGQSSSEYDALSSLEDIFTYTTTSSSSSSSSVVDALSNEFSNFISQLQNLTSGKSDASESAIREEAMLLATKFNTASTQLNTAWNQQNTDLTDYGVTQVNSLLKNIAALSDQIKSAEVSGNPALELKDQRNLMLDQLSQYVSIKVTETPVGNGSGTTVNQMSVSLADADGNSLGYTLIDGNQYAKFYTTQIGAADKSAAGLTSTSSYNYVEMHLSGLTKDGDSYTVTSGTLSGFPVTAAADSKYTFLTDSVDAAGNPISAQITIPAGTYNTLDDLKTAVQTGIGSSSLAGKVSVSVSGSTLQFSTSDGSALFVSQSSGDNVLNVSGMDNSDLKSGSFAGYLSLLNESGEFDTLPANATTTERGIGYYSQLLDSIASKLASVMNSANSTNDAGDNKPLFTSDGTSTSNITAGNIQLASAWTTGYLTTSKDTANSGDSTDTSYSNITSMILALTGKDASQTLMSKNGVSIYSGTIQKAVANVATTLGQDVNSINSTNSTNSSLLNTIDTHRQSNSSVSIDDEAIDLVQFNQSLTAASRFMTAVDECLQTIISSMGVAGRG